MEEIELLDWYNKLNEENEGIAKITVPVIDSGGAPTDMDTTDDGEIINTVNKVPDDADYKGNVAVTGKTDDDVVDKDKGNSLVSFVATRRIQDILVRLASLDEPYEADSVERQGLIDTVKSLYIKLGEYISSL